MTVLHQGDAGEHLTRDLRVKRTDGENVCLRCWRRVVVENSREGCANGSIVF